MADARGVPVKETPRAATLDTMSTTAAQALWLIPTASLLAILLAACGGSSGAEMKESIKNNNAGLELVEEGRVEEGMVRYTEAIRLDPGSAPAYNNRAAAYGVLGELERAIEDFTVAIHLDPKLAEARAGRALAFAQRNMSVEAQEDVDRAVELGFDCFRLNRLIEETTRGDPFERVAFCIGTAPDLEFTLYQGADVLGATDLSLSDIKGKPLVLNFWAARLPPSRSEMPNLQTVHAEYADRVNLIGLDVGAFFELGSRQEARDLLGQLDVTYPTGYPLDKEKELRFGSQRYPRPSSSRPTAPTTERGPES